MTARPYIRISRQDEAAILENQRREVKDYTARLGIHDAPLYEDVASGADTDRPGWNQLMKDLHQGDVVIFTSLSRMTRGGIGAAWEILRQLEAAGAGWHFTRGGIGAAWEILRQLEAAGAGWHFTSTPLLNFDADTPKLVRDVILAVLAAVDEDYRRNIAERTRAFYKRRTALVGPNATVKDWRKARGPDKRPRKKRNRPVPRIQGGT